MSIFKRLFGKGDKKTNETKNQPKPPTVPEPIEKDNLKGESKDFTQNKDALPKEAQKEFERIMNQMGHHSENSSEEFKQEIEGETFARYFSSPGLSANISIKDENGDPVALHVALKEVYDVWKNIKSPWDKRSVLFEYLDIENGKKLEKWQMLERLIKDRQALEAMEFQKNKLIENDYRDIRLILALAKLYRVMNSKETAMKYAKYAFESNPDLDIVKVEYANNLHLSDSHEQKEQSHKIFHEVMEKKIKASKEDSIAILNYFLFSEDYIDSSVFAISLLIEGKASEESWAALEDEYYWCPFYRYEHAVFLTKNGDHLRAMAKLNSLANEFPWYRPGVMASIDCINQMREQTNNHTLMSDEMKQLEQYKNLLDGLQK